MERVGVGDVYRAAVPAGVLKEQVGAGQAVRGEGSLPSTRGSIDGDNAAPGCRSRMWRSAATRKPPVPHAGSAMLSAGPGPTRRTRVSTRRRGMWCRPLLRVSWTASSNRASRTSPSSSPSSGPGVIPSSRSSISSRSRSGSVTAPRASASARPSAVSVRLPRSFRIRSYTSGRSMSEVARSVRQASDAVASSGRAGCPGRCAARRSARLNNRRWDTVSRNVQSGTPSSRSRSYRLHNRSAKVVGRSCRSKGRNGSLGRLLLIGSRTPAAGNRSRGTRSDRRAGWHRRLPQSR